MLEQTGKTTSYWPFASQILGPIPGILALLAALVIATVGLRDLGLFTRVSMRRWDTPACFVGLAILGLELATKSVWEYRTGGLSPDSPASGALLLAAGVGLGLLTCCLTALWSSRSTTRAALSPGRQTQPRV